MRSLPARACAPPHIRALMASVLSAALSGSRGAERDRRAQAKRRTGGDYHTLRVPRACDRIGGDAAGSRPIGRWMPIVATDLWSAVAIGECVRRGAASAAPTNQRPRAHRRATGRRLPAAAAAAAAAVAARAAASEAASEAALKLAARLAAARKAARKAAMMAASVPGGCAGPDIARWLRRVCVGLCAGTVCLVACAVSL